MFEQDYIMRLINEIVRAILKLLFGIDTASPTDELLKGSEEKETLEKLYDLVDAGKISEAENMIYDLTETGEMVKLEIALLFYAYLNDKDDDFLEANDFSREEVKNGLTDIASRYGLNGIVETFLTE